MRDVVEADAAHQATKRDADGLLARRLAFPALAEDVALLLRVRDELGAELRAAAAAGGGYVAFSRPYDRELEQLRTQAAFGQFVEQRALRMSAVERRQFDALMRWPRPEGARIQSKPEH